MTKGMHKTKSGRMAKKGLWYNIHQKRKRGGKPRKPGSKGLDTATGNYVTKQSAGIYSTERPNRAFKPKDPKIYQAEIDAESGPRVSEEANGTANIETYTIMHDRKGPSFGILFGRLTDNSRFIANTPNDPALLEDMTSKDYLGAKGKVSSAEGINVFTPD